MFILKKLLEIEPVVEIFKGNWFDWKIETVLLLIFELFISWAAISKLVSLKLLHFTIKWIASDSRGVKKLWGAIYFIQIQIYFLMKIFVIILIPHATPFFLTAITYAINDVAWKKNK